MSDEGKKYGLDLPREDSPLDRGDETSTTQTWSTLARAAHLQVIDEHGNMLNGHALLDQMEQKLLQMPASSDEEATATEYATNMCLDMIRQVRTQVSADELAPLDSHHFLLLLGYMYGKLSMPNPRHYNELYKSYNTTLKQRTGLKSMGIEQQRGNDWIKEKAAEIWQRDYDQQLRIGTVVTQVSELAAEEAKKRKAGGDDSAWKYWPKSPDKIRKAIREVAPTYAVKGGRPPKN